MSATGRSNVRRAQDYYATPGWVTRAIRPHLPPARYVLDPCCGDGAILREFGPHTDLMPRYGIDIEHRPGTNPIAFTLADALDERTAWPSADLIITSPPYRLAEEFLARALRERQKTTGVVCAFLLRLNFLGSQRRAEFHRRSPADVFVLPRRPSFTGGGTDATEYAWFLWGHPLGGGHWRMLEVDDSGR